MTASQFKTAPSPFQADSTPSGKCGFTLMNNQVGVVVAQVCDQLPNVKVTPLPSMIRVDAVGRMDVVYDDVSEALGGEPGGCHSDDDRIVAGEHHVDDDHGQQRTELI